MCAASTGISSEGSSARPGDSETLLCTRLLTICASARMLQCWASSDTSTDTRPWIFTAGVVHFMAVDETNVVSVARSVSPNRHRSCLVFRKCRPITVITVPPYRGDQTGWMQMSSHGACHMPVCVRARARARVRACVRACVHLRVTECDKARPIPLSQL